MFRFWDFTIGFGWKCSLWVGWDGNRNCAGTSLTGNALAFFWSIDASLPSAVWALIIEWMFSTGTHLLLRYVSAKIYTYLTGRTQENDTFCSLDTAVVAICSPSKTGNNEATLCHCAGVSDRRSSLAAATTVLSKRTACTHCFCSSRRWNIS